MKIILNPFPRGRGRRNDVHLVLADGVDKFYFPGVKADATVRIGTGSTVFEVAFYHASNPGKLAPDLVLTSRKQPDFHQ